MKILGRWRQYTPWAVTILTVLFSILVQGLTLGTLVRRTVGAPTQVPLPDQP